MLIKLAWRNLWRNKFRTGIMLGAMVFGLMGVATMMGFMAAMTQNMVKNAIAWQTSHIQIHHADYIENPDIKSMISNPAPMLEALKSIDEVAAFSTRFVADGMIASARSNKGVRVNGIDLAEESTVTPISSHIQAGEWLTEEGRNPILVSAKTAKRLKLRVGSKVVVTFTSTQSEVTGVAFRVRGIFQTPNSTFDEGNVFVRKADLIKANGDDALEDNPYAMHEIAIKLHHRDHVASVMQVLGDTVHTPNEMRDWQTIQPMLATMISTMGVSNLIMLAIFLLAMGFGIVNIMLMSVFERTREFGVLMAVGMQKHKVFTLIVFEAFLLGLAGAIAGVTASSIAMLVLQFTGLPLGSMADGLGAFGVDTILYPYLTVDQYITTFIAVLITALLAAFYPALQILNKRPVQAMAEKH